MARGATTNGNPPPVGPAAVTRYALPAFTEPGEQAPQATESQRRAARWNKDQLGPVPAPRGDARIDLAEIIGAPGVAEIEQLGEIRFHALGDSGVNHAEPAEQVADEMATDFKAGAGGLNPAFLLHLGDVVYGTDKTNHYGERFYRPYRNYPGKIIAIPGNHDGEAKSAADQPSLKAFQANFCAPAAVPAPQAAGSGIFRTTMTQPGVYWLLDAPFVRIIGLYSNRLEDEGYLEGRTTAGAADLSQLDWLKTTLKAVAAMPDRKALIVATHHPSYTTGGHSPSPAMNQSIDDACREAGIIPDVFLSGHAHSYQRYTRRIGGKQGKQVPYIVAGTGGIGPQKVPPATGQPTDASNDVTYDTAVASFGYLFVTVSARQLKLEFWELGEEHTKPFDAATVDLADHILTN